MGNNILKNLWTYNRILKFHNKRYTNYYMEPSKKYEKIIYPWKIQYNLMKPIVLKSLKL